MMAPHGTPMYAITSGRVTRMTGSSPGGISLYKPVPLAHRAPQAAH